VNLMRSTAAQRRKSATVQRSLPLRASLGGGKLLSHAACNGLLCWLPIASSNQRAFALKNFLRAALAAGQAVTGMRRRSIQVFPTYDYKVYLYFAQGEIRLFAVMKFLSRVFSGY